MIPMPTMINRAPAIALSASVEIAAFVATVIARTSTVPAQRHVRNEPHNTLRWFMRSV
jgi:hypothetical protein